MKTRQFGGAFAFLVLVSVFGTGRTAAQKGGGEPPNKTCDQRCVMRQEHKDLSSNKCWKFSIPTCVWCGAGPAGPGVFTWWCDDASYQTGKSYCNMTTQNGNIVTEWSTCTEVCTPPPVGATMVEATVGGTPTNPNAYDLHECEY